MEATPKFVPASPRQLQQPNEQHHNPQQQHALQPSLKYPQIPEDALTTLPAAFYARVAASPSYDAFLKLQDGQWKRRTWAQYGNSVTRVARGLIALGVAPGEKVCIFGKTRHKWSIFFLAALSIGAVPTAIGSASKKQEIAHVINHSEAVVVLLEKQSQLKKLRSAVKSFTFIRHIILNDIGDDEKCVSWKHFLRKGDGHSDVEADRKKRLEKLSADEVASLIYSPGTEEKRNAIMLSHRNLLWTASKVHSQLGIDETDCYISFLSMSHAAEQIMAIVLPIYSGMQIYYAPDITRLLHNVREVQPTVIAAPPEFWASSFVALKTILASTAATSLSEELLDQIRKSVGCGRIKRALIGGNSQNCPSDMYEFYKSLGVQLIHAYGQLETTGLCTMNIPSTQALLLSTPSTSSTSATSTPSQQSSAQTASTRYDNLGQPLPDCHVTISSEKEILVQGPNVFLGYYKDPAQTEAVLKGGVYHTGDMGDMDTHGNLVFKGRKVDIIQISEGQTLHPFNLETSLRSIPHIKYAIVVGESGKDHVGVLLILDLNSVKRVAKKKNSTPKRLFASPDFQMQLKQHVDNIAKSEKVKVRRFSIVARPLSVKKGELTSTMSVRRKIFYAHFANEIERLFKDGPKTDKDELQVAHVEGTKDKNNEGGGGGAGDSNKGVSGDASKKVTDGHFYRKTAAGEFRRTELKQSEVEDMEKTLMTAMKEIRDLAKRIKMLQEQHTEDTELLNGRDQNTQQHHNSQTDGSNGSAGGSTATDDDSDDPSSEGDNTARTSGASHNTRKSRQSLGKSSGKKIGLKKEKKPSTSESRKESKQRTLGKNAKK
eukprot:TRINITY_DN588_c0_g1_i4.p1 TRINITY_DN588_c0_g1~~TRINITY_DN588_c0_g1_i4.p1  ORF type:complete len:828 (-),score=166.70 TRINITY_DN588_c0_g1_i4:1280-3763(-)